MNKMKEKTSLLWVGIVIGAFIMFFFVNFAGNNFFAASMISPNTCAMMHGNLTYFHHFGFWITLAILVAFGIIICKMLRTQKERKG